MQTFYDIWGGKKTYIINASKPNCPSGFKANANTDGYIQEASPAPPTRPPSHASTPVIAPSAPRVC